mgnify:CR=1 FL=1
MGRPAGAKNKTTTRSRMAAHSQRALADEMSIFLHHYMGAGSGKIEHLIETCFDRATDREDKYAHHFAKLILERVIPQRKQIENVGDVSNMGVVINVTTEGKSESQGYIDGETGELRSEGRISEAGDEEGRQLLREISRPDEEVPEGSQRSEQPAPIKPEAVEV